MNVSFFIIMLCYSFSSEAVSQDMARDNPTEKQIDAEMEATLQHATTQKLTEEKT